MLFNRSFKNLFVYFSHELIIELVILIEKSNFGLSLTISELLSERQERTKISHFYSACKKYSLVESKTWPDIRDVFRIQSSFFAKTLHHRSLTVF